MHTFRAARTRRPEILLPFVALAVGLIGVAGCSSASPSASGAPSSAAAPAASPSALAAPYQSPDGYTISPPEGWVLHPTTGVQGLSLLFASPTADTAGQKPFADNLNVVVITTSETLDNLVAQTRQQTPTVLANYKMTTDQPTTVNGQPARLLGGTYDQEGVGSVENIQLSLVSGGKGYTITFTTPAASFGRYRDLAQASLSSFTVS